MLSDMLKSHQQRQQQQKKVQEERRLEAVAASKKLTSALVDHLNIGVAEAYANQKRIDSEARLLQRHVSTLNRQSQQWLQLSETMSTALKELGDVENWAQCVEADMKNVSDTLQSAYSVYQSVPVARPTPVPRQTTG